MLPMKKTKYLLGNDGDGSDDEGDASVGPSVLSSNEGSPEGDSEDESSGGNPPENNSLEGDDSLSDDGIGGNNDHHNSQYYKGQYREARKQIAELEEENQNLRAQLDRLRGVAAPPTVRTYIWSPFPGV